MRSEVYKILNLEDRFKEVGDGKSNKGNKSTLDDIVRAPGSGISGDLIAHQQGMYCLNQGNGDFIVVGSAKENPGYFYTIKDNKGYCGNGDKKYWTIDDVMTHPGGIQVAESLLVIGNEQYNGAETRTDRSNIRFYDISDEDNVSELKHLKIERRGDGMISSAIGLTKLGEQWIMAIRGKRTMDFYSMKGDPTNSANKFEELSSIDLKANDMKDFQCANLFIGTTDSDDKIYLIGMPDGSTNSDECWLYLLNTNKNDQGKITSIISATQLVHKHFYRNGDGPRFKWASCACFIPSNGAGSTGATDGKFRIYSASAHVDDKKIRCNWWE